MTLPGQWRFSSEANTIYTISALPEILQFMYPIEGNEAAVGLDYRTLPDQLAAVELALSLNEIVLAGPLTLVQGGEE